MCNRCSFFIPQTAIDTLFQHHKLQYPTITEHPTHHIHYDLPSPKLHYFTKSPIHKLKYNFFQDLTPVGLSKTNLNPTKICTSARVCWYYIARFFKRNSTRGLKTARIGV